MTIIFEHDATANVKWRASSPSLPEATAEGETREQCEAAMHTAITTILTEKATRLKAVLDHIGLLRITAQALFYEIEDYAKKPVNFRISMDAAEKELVDFADKIKATFPSQH